MSKQGYTAFVRTEGHEPDTLQFAAPLQYGYGDSWRNDVSTTRFDVQTIILEETGHGRSTFTIWDLDAESGHWDMTDDEPGIVQIMYDETDAPCTDCESEVPSYDFEHSEDCWNDDDECRDEHYCCDNHRDAAQAAHIACRESLPDDERPNCTLTPDYYMLDGGDAACTFHVREWFGAEFLKVPATDNGNINDENLLKQYFDTRRLVADADEESSVRNLPSSRSLRDLADLTHYRRLFEQMESKRSTRDSLVSRVRDDLSAETVAKYSGLTEERVNQIWRNANESLRVLQERLEREGKENAAKESNND